MIQAPCKSPHICDVIDEQHNPEAYNEELNTMDAEKSRPHVSWAAYHVNRQKEDTRETSISTLLPLFPDDSKSKAMIKHSVDVVKSVVDIVNEGQIPVIACDQHLYKFAKDIQWTWSETHGEDSYVVMLGGLHIKMTLLKCLGDLLDGSGWTSAVSQA